MQNRLKITPSKSSADTSPVISPIEFPASRSSSASKSSCESFCAACVRSKREMIARDRECPQMPFARQEHGFARRFLLPTGRALQLVTQQIDAGAGLGGQIDMVAFDARRSADDQVDLVDDSQHRDAPGGALGSRA